MPYSEVQSSGSGLGEAASAVALDKGQSAPEPQLLPSNDPDTTIWDVCGL